MGSSGPAPANPAAANANVFDLTDENEREQLEGFMMMYELLRPICRASLNEETVQERKKSKMNLKT